MAQGFTSQAARNIFYGGTVFFVLLFAAIVFHTEQRIPERSKAAEITPAVVRGKHLGKPVIASDAHAAGRGRLFCAGAGQRLQAPRPRFHQGLDQEPAHRHAGRRQMPNFNFSDAQLDDMVEFLKWTNGVDTEKWPPNIEG